MSKNTVEDVWSNYVDYSKKLFLDLDSSHNLLVVNSIDRSVLVSISNKLKGKSLLSLVTSLGFDRK